MLHTVIDTCDVVHQNPSHRNKCSWPKATWADLLDLGQDELGLGVLLGNGIISIISASCKAINACHLHFSVPANWIMGYTCHTVQQHSKPQL